MAEKIKIPFYRKRTIRGFIFDQAVELKRQLPAILSLGGRVIGAAADGYDTRDTYDADANYKWQRHYNLTQKD